MNCFKKLTAIFILFFISSGNVKAGNFQDVLYTFDAQKNQAAEDSFHFLRSYVDYFYLLIKANKSHLQAFNKLSNVSGWCVGDAHAENFGVLIQKDQSSLFTMNDMDDFGPCPVALDLYRFMVSTKLYDKNIQLDLILRSYLSGLKNDHYPKPDSIKMLLEKSQEKGTGINPKKVSSDRIVRESSMSEVSVKEKDQILFALNQIELGLTKNYKVLDLISTRKIGGGSGGLLRYEILITDNNHLIQLELKEEIIPSIYPVATAVIPQFSERLQKAINLEQGPMASSLYNSLQLNGRSMLIRPRFSGNMGISLKGNSKSENTEIIYYEAYTLGVIHSRSLINTKEYIKLIKDIKIKDLESDVQGMGKLFDIKFNQLKK